MLANGLLILSYSFSLSHDAMCALQLTPSTINKEDLNTVVESAKEKVFDTYFSKVLIVLIVFDSL